MLAEPETQDIQKQLEKLISEFHDRIIENVGTHGSVLSMCVKDRILPPGLKHSTYESSTLAILEVVYCIAFNQDGFIRTANANWKEESLTFLVFFDSKLNKVGYLHIKDKLPSDLDEFVYNYSTPVPGDGFEDILKPTDAQRLFYAFKVTYKLPYTPVPITDFPGISELHRQLSWVDPLRGYERGHKHQKSSSTCNIFLKKTSIPDQSQQCSSDYSKSRCTILDALIQEQSNLNSRLSWLPIELIELVYSNIVKIWKSHVRTGGVFASVIAKVEFPPPSGINVNMMPIRLCAVSSIPENMKQYLPMLRCCPLHEAEFDRIGYLTIHEYFNEEAECQYEKRRPNTTGKVTTVSYHDPSVDKDLEGCIRLDYSGFASSGIVKSDSSIGSNYHYEGGLYIASNVSDSSRVWNCKVTNPEEIVGHRGDLEHMASYLGNGEVLKDGELTWITGRTPYQPLPVKKGISVQFFRLVTSQVSVWYADHSTPNPLGITPPDHVKIVHGNKFRETNEKFVSFDDAEIRPPLTKRRRFSF